MSQALLSGLLTAWARGGPANVAERGAAPHANVSRHDRCGCRPGQRWSTFPPPDGPLFWLWAWSGPDPATRGCGLAFSRQDGRLAVADCLRRSQYLHGETSGRQQMETFGNRGRSETLASKKSNHKRYGRVRGAEKKVDVTLGLYHSAPSSLRAICPVFDYRLALFMLR